MKNKLEMNLASARQAMNVWTRMVTRMAYIIVVVKIWLVSVTTQISLSCKLLSYFGSLI